MSCRKEALERERQEEEAKRRAEQMGGMPGGMGGMGGMPGGMGRGAGGPAGADFASIFQDPELMAMFQASTRYNNYRIVGNICGH